MEDTFENRFLATIGPYQKFKQATKQSVPGDIVSIAVSNRKMRKLVVKLNRYGQEEPILNISTNVIWSLSFHERYR